MSPEYDRDNHSVKLVEFVLQKCSKRHPNTSVLYICLRVVYMIFTHLAKLIKTELIQYLIKCNYKERFPT
ncbi:hypothetical protein FO524_31290 [Bacillus mycoides]|nr:hypothetical protein [Bacillus mycoides]